jgi:hypothetical protein
MEWLILKRSKHLNLVIILCDTVRGNNVAVHVKHSGCLLRIEFHFLYRLLAMVSELRLHHAVVCSWRELCKQEQYVRVVSSYGPRAGCGLSKKDLFRLVTLLDYH